MRTIRRIRNMFIQLGMIINGVLLIVIFAEFRGNQTQAEWWAKNISLPYGRFINNLNSCLPFSITEVLIISLVLSSIFLLVISIIYFVKRKPLKAINKFLIIPIVWVNVVGCYNVVAGPLYGRAPLDLELYEEKVDESHFYKLASYFIEDFSNCAKELGFDGENDVNMPYSFEELNERIHIEYDKLESDYFSNHNPTIKKMMTSKIYSMFGIIGWYFWPLAEGTINTDASNAELPFSMAHEMAHGKGVMREADAQTLAAYVCLSSDDPYLRYSAYISTYTSLFSLVSYLKDAETYNALYYKLDQRILLNHRAINEKWEELSVMDKIGDWINDQYLKLFGNKEGTTSYQDSQPVKDENNKVISLTRYQKLYAKIFLERFPGENLKNLA